MSEKLDKIKLIFPCRFESKKPYYYTLPYYLPYGMGQLTAFLRKHNYYVEQEDLSVRFNRFDYAFLPLRFKNKDLDLDIRKNKDEIPTFLELGEGGKLSLFINKILDSTSIGRFDVIGFSIFSDFHFLFALLLSKRIKQRTNTPIVFGGPFITLYGHLYPEVFDFVDYMIVGDGGVPLLRLIDYLNKKISISEVPNLIYKQDGKLIANPVEHYPIEEIPIPDFDGLPLNLYKNFKLNITFPYQITRGCAGRCSFCANRLVNDRLEFKSYEKVLSELSQMKERYKRYHNKIFHFCDDVINNSYEYLEGLCGLFIKHKLNINWGAYGKVGNLDKHILRKMKEAGCQWLIFGIESGSDRMLKMMNKGFTAEQASQTLKDAAEAGLKNFINLIVGYLYETQEDIQKTTSFIRKNRKYLHNVVIFKFDLYGSPMFFNPKKYDITILTSTPLRYSFTFDESSGLKWKQKQKQQENSQRQILKAVHKYMRFRIFFLLSLHYLRLLWLKLKEYVKKV